jgi:hypothetical protein
MIEHTHGVWYHTNICIGMAFGISPAFSFGLRSIGTAGLYLTLSQRFFLDTRLLGPYRRVVFPHHLRKIEFADPYYLLWCFGVHIASAYFLS